MMLAFVIVLAVANLGAWGCVLRVWRQRDDALDRLEYIISGERRR